MAKECEQFRLAVEILQFSEILLDGRVSSKSFKKSGYREGGSGQEIFFQYVKLGKDRRLWGGIVGSVEKFKEICAWNFLSDKIRRDLAAS